MTKVVNTENNVCTLHPTHEYRLARKPNGELVLQRLFWSSCIDEQMQRGSPTKVWANEKIVNLDESGNEI